MKVTIILFIKVRVFFVVIHFRGCGQRSIVLFKVLWYALCRILLKFSIAHLIESDNVTDLVFFFRCFTVTVRRN